MASPIRQIANGQLGNSAALLYVSATGTWTQIAKVTCTNTDTGTHVVTFHVVPSGGSALASNKSTITQGILPTQTWNSPNEYGLVLNPGDALYGFADTAAVVNYFVAGLLLN
jgi:hypothetical protein